MFEANQQEIAQVQQLITSLNHQLLNAPLYPAVLDLITGHSTNSTLKLLSELCCIFISRNLFPSTDFFPVFSSGYNIDTLLAKLQAVPDCISWDTMHLSDEANQCAC